MPDTTKEDESEGSRMIREIQEQRRREESAEANAMIQQIQAQQKLARRLMYEADPRTRVKPRPSLRQLMKKKGKVTRRYNALLTNHLENKQQKVENAEANSMIRKIQAQQKLARRLMYEADPRTRVKPAPSSRQLTKKLRASYQALSNQLNRQLMDEVRYRFRDTQHIKPNPNKKHTV
jgi:hypothetical protein